MDFKKTKKLLLVMPLYTIVLWICALLVMLIFLFVLPTTVLASDSLLESAIYYILFGVCTIAVVVELLIYLELAILTDEGIEIRNVFGKRFFVSWDEIISITIQKKLLRNEKAAINLNWIIIKCDEQHNIVDCGTNKINNGPWQIVASKRNVFIFNNFIKRFKPHLKQLDYKKI